MEKPVSADKKDGSYVFVCYSHQDAGVVYQQIQWLQSEGVSAWYDQGISPGGEWTDELALAIQNCSRVLYFVSPSSVASEHCRRELNFAQDEGREVVSIYLQPTEVPAGLRLALNNRQSVYQHELSQAQFREQLLRAAAGKDGLGPRDVEAPAANNRRGIPTTLGAIAVLLVVAVGAWWIVRDDHGRPANDEMATQTDEPITESTSSAQRLQTIAVLPFDNYSPNQDDAYFAAGITEEITGQLARIGDLTVLSRVAVERAVASENSLEDIARTLGAGTLLEGSVRMAGQQVRITAQLIEVKSQRHLWSKNFDRELTDIFQIQTEVALAIGDALSAQLSGNEKTRIESPVTGDIRAYQLYLRQRRIRAIDPAENEKAIALLEQALALDPDFAEARARLSWRHTWNARLTGDPLESERARSLALEALDYDSELPSGYYALGAALEELERMDEAGAAYARTYKLDPNFSSILADGSFYFAIQGAPAEGLEMAFRAVRLDPNSPNTRWHAYMPLIALGDIERSAAWLRLARDEGMQFHRLAAAAAEVALAKGNLAEAAAIAREMRKQFPDTYEARTMALQLLFLSGNVAEISEELVALGRQAPEAWFLDHIVPRTRRVLMGFALLDQGKVAAAGQVFDESLEATSEAVAKGSTFHGRALDAASIYAIRDDHDAALRELERAYDLGLRSDFALAVDPFFATLRDEPGFKKLLDRMADSKEEQRAIADRSGALDGFDAMIASGPAILERP